LVIRHLVQDHEQHAKAAGRLFYACDRGAITLVLLPVVLAECAFVLESFYERNRPEIAGALISLIDSPGIEIEDREMHADALRRYSRSKLPFVDCMIAANAAASGNSVATFDSGFRNSRTFYRHDRPNRRMRWRA